jgi:glycosyltransferase involved in cell wall biosynthesis
MIAKSPESHEGTVAAGDRAALRVACLGTHGGHAGGAAIAMERLAAGMRQCGANVDVVTRADVAATADVTALERRLRRAVKHGRRGESNTLLTLDWPAWDVAGHPAVAAADVVNLHWVAGFLDAESVRRLVDGGVPVIWTLHDERAFTGGCHYASGCTRFGSGCWSCPQLAPWLAEAPRRVLARTARRLRGRRIVFTSPSRWLAGELTRSAVFDPDHHAIHVVPNGIDLARYAPSHDRAAVRRRLGLPEAGLGILLGSVSLDERRKGGREAAAALARLAALVTAEPAPAAPPFVVTYGGGRLPIEGLAVRHLGPLDEAGVIAALHASDVHLTMTREDNLPNTVMEAMACGVPVVATAVGGLTDMIADGHDGWLVPCDDARAAAGVLARLAREPGVVVAAAAHARARAQAQWDDRAVAARFLAIAAGLVADTHRPAPAACAATRALSPAAAVVLGGGRWLRGARRRLRRSVAWWH